MIITYVESIQIIEIIFVERWESELFIEECEVEVIFVISWSHCKRVAERQWSELFKELITFSAIVLIEFVSIVT